MTSHPLSSRSTRDRAGIALALGAAVLFGGVNAAARAAIQMGLDPLWAAGLAYVSGGLVLSPWLRSARIARADWPRLAVAIGAGAIVGPLFLYEGLARSGAVVASLLLNLEMAFTAALAFIVLRERVRRGREQIGLALIGIGAVLVSLASAGGGATALIGALMISTAALSWGIDNVASTTLAQRHDPRALIAWKTLIGGAVVLVLSAALAPFPTHTPVLSLGLALGAGVVGVAVSSVLMYAAFARIGATRTVVLFSASSLVGAAAGHFVLGEPLGALHVVALCVILAGVALVALGRSSPGPSSGD